MRGMAEPGHPSGGRRRYAAGGRDVVEPRHESDGGVETMKSGIAEAGPDGGSRPVVPVGGPADGTRDRLGRRDLVQARVPSCGADRRGVARRRHIALASEPNRQPGGEVPRRLTVAEMRARPVGPTT